MICGLCVVIAVTSSVCVYADSRSTQESLSFLKNTKDVINFLQSIQKANSHHHYHSDNAQNELNMNYYTKPDPGYPDITRKDHPTTSNRVLPAATPWNPLLRESHLQRTLNLLTKIPDHFPYLFSKITTRRRNENEHEPPTNQQPEPETDEDFDDEISRDKKSEGAGAEDDYVVTDDSRDDNVCAAVCTRCAKFLALRWASLCWKHCSRGGEAFNACLVITNSWR